jgi:hypothetical protein
VWPRLYENARTAVHEVLADDELPEVDRLFPAVGMRRRTDAADAAYTRILLVQLESWLHAYVVDEPISPELVLVDPELRQTGPAPEPVETPWVPAPPPRRAHPLPVAAAAYAVGAAARTLAVDLAFLFALAVLVLVLSRLS